MADAKTALATRRENGGVAVNTIADDIRKMQDRIPTGHAARCGSPAADP